LFDHCCAGEFDFILNYNLSSQ
jgi:hypothetical protein